MNERGHRILSALEAVEAERRRQALQPGLGQRARDIKAFQHTRFAWTYADLLGDTRYAAAARFFLDELYGPHDFAERDAQFARIVPALVRLFPQEIVGTVETLAQLHALSEELDGRMADALMAARPGSAVSGVDAALYPSIWRAVGQEGDRERQIAWMMEVGRALDRLTRKPLLRHTLRLMRGPAQAASLSALQRFLERGFDTFGAMRDAQAFLQTIAQRERELAAALFAGLPPEGWAPPAGYGAAP